MTQQVTGRIGYEGAGHGPYRPGTGTPGWDVVPAPRPAPVTPHPAPAPAWAAPYVPVASVAPAPPASPGAPRSLVVVAVTVVALAVLTLVGVLLYPRIAAPVATTATTAAPTTVVVPAPASSGSSAGAYSCGSANGYAIEVLNGNVPCTSARWVTTMWTTDGTTPMSGTGPAGTPYSWTCSGVTTSGDEVASCVSKKGSTFTISR